MDFLVAWRGVLPAEARQMEESVWVELWGRRFWPYKALSPGARLYWLELPTKIVAWDTTVRQVSAFPYHSPRAALNRVRSEFAGEIRLRSAEERRPPEDGFCIAWTVYSANGLTVDQPEWVSPGHVRWLRLPGGLRSLEEAGNESKTKTSPTAQAKKKGISQAGGFGTADVKWW